MKIENLKDNYQCDNGHKFAAKDVELSAFGTGFCAPFLSIVFVAPDGTIHRGVPNPSDFVLACPLCHQTHLQGFDKA